MSGAVEGVALPAPEDLRPWGYAPGNYVFKCQDCPPDPVLYERMGKLGDKRAWRCREHAIAARDAASDAAEPRTTPPARSYADGVRDAAAVVDAEYDLRKHHHAANKAAGNKKEARDFETMMIAHAQSAAAIRLLPQGEKA